MSDILALLALWLLMSVPLAALLGAVLGNRDAQRPRRSVRRRRPGPPGAGRGRWAA